MKPSRQRARRAGALAVVAVVGLGLGLDLGLVRRRLRVQAGRLRHEAQELAGCVYGATLPAVDQEAATLRRRLGRHEASETPLAGCAHEVESIEALGKGLGAMRLRRSGDAPARLRASVEALEAVPLTGAAGALHRRAPELAAAVGAVVDQACAIAAIEDGQASCLPARQAAGELASRVVLDVPAGGEARWVATAGERDVSVRAASDGQAWEARSLDGGRQFTVAALPGQAPGPELAPSLVDDAGGRRRLVRALAAGGWSELVEVSGEGARARPLPALPAGASAAPLGVRAVETPDGWASVGRGADGRGVVVWEGGAARAAPEGELLGAFQQGGARLLVKRQAPSGYVELVTVPVPGRDRPWEPGLSAVVAYVPSLAPSADIERVCGLPDERFSTWVGAGGKDAALVASSATALHAYRFHTEPGTGYRVICGSCPPMALEAHADGLGLFVPIRRSLTPARLTTPALFEPGRSDASAQAACTPSALAVVYEAGGEVVAQRREPQGWRFEPPVVVAATDARGRPEAPAIVGVGDDLVVLWRRAAPGRLRVEARRLDDVPREPLPVPSAPPAASAPPAHHGRGVDPG